MLKKKTKAGIIERWKQAVEAMLRYVKEPRGEHVKRSTLSGTIKNLWVWYGLVVFGGLSKPTLELMLGFVTTQIHIRGCHWQARDFHP